MKLFLLIPVLLLTLPACVKSKTFDLTCQGGIKRGEWDKPRPDYPFQERFIINNKLELGSMISMAINGTWMAPKPVKYKESPLSLVIYQDYKHVGSNHISVITINKKNPEIASKRDESKDPLIYKTYSCKKTGQN